MSLEALNSPPLVGALTVGCYGLLPIAASNPALVTSLPFAAIKGINLLSYGFSVYSVGRPGRYDGAAAVTETSSSSNNNKTKESSSSPAMSEGARRGMEQMSPSKGRTLVPPAGWAFAIWGPIFLGELFMVVAPWFGPVSPRAEWILREISGPYALAQAFQALWAASFRPKYGSRGGAYKYASVANLAGIAAALSLCHGAFSGAGGCGCSALEYGLYCLPLAMHFGWTTAAAIVNANGMYALAGANSGEEDSPGAARSVAVLGHASVLAATAIGISVAWTRDAPVYGGVVVWALAAVASGLKQRIAGAESVKRRGGAAAVGIYGAERQRVLSLSGAAVCALAVAAVVLK